MLSGVMNQFNHSGGFGGSTSNYQPNIHYMQSTSNSASRRAPTGQIVLSDEEKNNSEVIEKLTDLEKAIYDVAYKSEVKYHPFAEYYRDAKFEYNFAKNLRASLENYTHQKAIRFIAKSYVWFRRPPPTTEVLPTAPVGVKAVCQFIFVDNIHAIYRVISEKENKYILLACHYNVHGFNRGDLRFVEVDNKTKTNASPYSCIGHLALGDLVAVTELATTDQAREKIGVENVYNVTQETPCFWTVKSMTLLRRQTFENVPFSFLENGMAVALKWGQVLTVKNRKRTDIISNTVYTGNGFIPEKVPEFATGLTPDQQIQLTGLTREITKYPFSTGTIFSHEYSPYYTSQMNVGLAAYRSNVPDPEGVVELCALMGATAVTAVFTGNFDCRSFRMIDPRRENDLIRFGIENTQDPKPEGLWKASTRITIGSTKMDANAVIETILVLGNELRIVARLSREHYDFEFVDAIHMVSQREMPEGKGLRDGFLETIPFDSNGRMIITALYGGPAIISQPISKFNQYFFPGAGQIPLNQFQNEYVDRLLQRTPLTLANSPFGCGKSMTIATAAYYAVLESRSLDDRCQQLIVTQSNFASVNLVDITKRYTKSCRVIRYVSENNWLELPDEGRTDLDLPLRMQQAFMPYVQGATEYKHDYGLFQMAIFLKERNLIKVEDMNPKCQNFFRINKHARKYDFYKLTRIFFSVFDPEIIITTSDSLRSVLPILRQISTVQFDEASQVPECALIQILSTFPYACFGLVGDIQQLPPYCDLLLTGHLKTYGIGNTMERAITCNLFPQVVLRYVYRCHPVTTQILGQQFYEGRLISGITAEDRNELMTQRPDFWPNPKFPIMVVNNTVPSFRMGTSLCNQNEVMIVKNIVYALTSPTYNYTFKPTDIGVISFYKAQSAILVEQFRDLNVKCGTVDSFQGTEKEIIILCCTNEVVNGFLAMKNRINVAMSRAKQTTIIVGNVYGLQQAQHWKTFVEFAHLHRCIRS